LGFVVLERGDQDVRQVGRHGMSKELAERVNDVAVPRGDRLTYSRQHLAFVLLGEPPSKIAWWEARFLSFDPSSPDDTLTVHQEMRGIRVDIADESHRALVKAFLPTPTHETNRDVEFWGWFWPWEPLPDYPWLYIPRCQPGEPLPTMTSWQVLERINGFSVKPLEQEVKA
jgi:hypothetical protein